MNDNDNDNSETDFENEIDVLLSLVERLVDELASEMQLHLSDDRLREMRRDRTVRLLFEAARSLRAHDVDLPGPFQDLAMIVTSDKNSA